MMLNVVITEVANGFIVRPDDPGRHGMITMNNEIWVAEGDITTLKKLLHDLKHENYKKQNGEEK